MGMFFFVNPQPRLEASREAAAQATPTPIGSHGKNRSSQVLISSYLSARSHTSLRPTVHHLRAMRFLLPPSDRKEIRSSPKSVMIHRSKLKWALILLRNLLRTSSLSSVSSPAVGSAKPPSLSPLPKRITDQISTEIYELIIDHLSVDIRSLLVCNLVCRSWVPRSQCVLLRRMPCRPVHVVNRGQFGTTNCAVSLVNNGGILCGTKDGVFRSSDGLRLLPLRSVSQIEILPDLNLVLCVAGGTFFTLRLSVLNSGAFRPDDMTRLLENVSCFAVFRSSVVGESHRVSVFKGSSFGTVHIFDVSGDQLVLTQALGVTRRHFQFLSATHLLTWSKNSTMHGGFDFINLAAPQTPIRTLLDCRDPSLAFALKNVKPRTVFRVAKSNTFLVCYEKLAFHIDGKGRMARNELVMEWTCPSNSFAIHEPYILAFCNKHMEVWNMETAQLMQTIKGSFRPLNASDASDRILTLSNSCRDVVEFVFHQAG
ncbi:CNH domain-containing protein [Mycena metata]|uniref:CNH domain-containing protein n=1 Tax=Mycena metata TaxID=1033252 RepID=A0AAD7II72_9AGAR|nr:CNH domain-containing protein [Mycena metata]